MAVAFKPGQKFKFSDNDSVVYTFISLHYHEGEPVIVYEDENGKHDEAFGFDLSDLIHA